MPLAELEEVQLETFSAIRSAGIVADSDINVKENRIELYVTDRSQFDSPPPDGSLDISLVNIIVVDVCLLWISTAALL